MHLTLCGCLALNPAPKSQVATHLTQTPNRNAPLTMLTSPLMAVPAAKMTGPLTVSLAASLRLGAALVSASILSTSL